MKLEKLPWSARRSSNRKTVAVFGDLILDEYLEGEVKRISPEAPVPVHVVKERTIRAGGAANTALNVQRAGGRAVLFGYCGDDASGNDLINLLKASGVDTTHILRDKGRPTIRKTRISSGHHQIVRVDWEKVVSPSLAIVDKLLLSLNDVKFDALLLSDYGKGALSGDFVQKLLGVAAKRKVRSIVDPKGIDYARYRGADFITPNRLEALTALGISESSDAEKEEIANNLLEKFGLNAVLLTLGAQGMYFCQANKKNEGFHLSAQAREVFDVSGAGDTVAGVLALGVAANVPIRDAIHYANVAAGIVVGKWGTQPVEEEELVRALVGAGERSSARDKVRSVESLVELLGEYSARSSKVVFTNGCFDILHAGHVQYLEQARDLGGILVVGVNSDESVRKLKGKHRPIIGLADRMLMLAGLACVDYVVSFDDDTPLKVIEALQPAILVKGGDWQKDQIVGAKIVEDLGGEVRSLKFVPGISTTEIERRILER